MQLTRQQSREVDRYAIETLGFHPLILMENAARATRELILQFVKPTGPGLFVCGKGNNGGDGLALARQMLILERECLVLLTEPPERLSDDARANYDLLSKGGQTIDVWHGERSQFDNLVSRCDWIVDAMLGTGVEGDPRPPYAELISLANDSGKPIVALDVPSGLDCDTGSRGTPTIRARDTITFVAIKRGFLAEAASPYRGNLLVADIGFPLDWLPDDFLE